MGEAVTVNLYRANDGTLHESQQASSAHEYGRDRFRHEIAKHILPDFPTPTLRPLIANLSPEQKLAVGAEILQLIAERSEAIADVVRRWKQEAPLPFKF